MKRAGPGAGRTAAGAPGALSAVLPVSFVALAAIGGWALVRGVDQDEGFYLLAGRQVLEGARLYADVFFPQMPGLPWAEAGLFAFWGPSLFAGRALSVVPGAVTAGLVALLVGRAAGSWRAGMAGGLLCAFNGTLWNSLAVVKTYGLANLLVVTAVLLAAGGGRAGPYRWFGAGLAAGGAVAVRWPAGAVGAVLFADALRRRRWGAASALAAGAAVALLPVAAAALADPAAFWFCNVTFHALRRELWGWEPVLAQKAGVVARWLLLPQHAVLWALVAWSLPRLRGAAALSLACVAVLAAGYASATPTYVHYASQFLPLLVVAAAPALGALARRPRLLVLVVTVYVAGLYPAVRPVPEGHPLAAKRAQWSLETVGAVAAFVREHTPPGALVLSWWSGYPVLAGRREVRGVGFWESNAARKVSPGDARRFHLLRLEEIRAMVERGEPQAIVTADWAWQDLRATMRADYRPAFERAGVEVWLPRGAAIGRP